MKFAADFGELALTFDDVLLVPGYSQADFDASYMCDGAVRARVAPE